MTPLTTPSATPSPLNRLYTRGLFAETLDAYTTGGDAWRGDSEASLLAASAAARIGDGDQAWQLATSALIRVTREEDLARQYAVLSLMGDLCLDAGSLERAEVAFNSAAQLASDLGDPIASAAAWSNLGRVSHLRRHPLHAVEYFRRALDAYTDAGDATGVARNRYRLALVHRDLGEFDRAATHLGAAWESAAVTCDDGLKALILMGCAELAIHQGRLALANAELARGRELALRAADRRTEAEAARVESLLALEEGRNAAARLAAQSGARIASTLGDSLLEAECDALKALALHALWRVDEAATDFDHALARIRSAGATRLAAQVERRWNAAQHR